MVKVEGVEERDSTNIRVRVVNLDHNGAQDDDGDGLPDNQKEVSFVAERFDKVYSMDVRLADAFSGDTQRVELPPGGSMSVELWVRNTGNASMDMAVFDFSGLEGLATREVLVYGLPVTGPLYIPEGYGSGTWPNPVSCLTTRVHRSLSGTRKPPTGPSERRADGEPRELEIRPMRCWSSWC